MFKRLLVPVDGSELAERAMQAGIDLARQLGASITAFIAEPPGPLPSPGYGALRYVREEVRAHRIRLAEPAAATANTFIAGDEGAVADTEDEREVALLNHAQQQLDAVSAALQRLVDASYGDCERCGVPIGMPRLRAIPEARLCLACQMVVEGRGE